MVYLKKGKEWSKSPKDDVQKEFGEGKSFERTEKGRRKEPGNKNRSCEKKVDEKRSGWGDPG